MRILTVLLLASSLTAAEQPNVLFICVDDLKPTIGCFGDPLAKTPNMDRLAKHGVVFRSSFVNQAVCAPSRNSLMTGLRPEQIGVYDLGTWFRHGAPNAITISQRFMQNGYHAESMGKIYHQGQGNVIDPASWSVPPWFPSDKGLPHDTSGGPKPPPGSTQKTPTPGMGSTGDPWGWPDAPDSEFKDNRCAVYAVERLTALTKTGKPFFMGVGFAKPHLSFIVPKHYWDLFANVDLPVFPVNATLPTGAPSFAGHTFGELRNYTDIQEVGPLTAEQSRTMVHGYYASTAFVDAQLGLVLDAVDKLDLWKNTIVVLWGDHGWHLGDHGLWCKHTNFEQAAHNPVIIAAPGKAADTQTQSLIETVDLYPTLCALAHIEPPVGLAGKSLVPILDDPKVSVQDAVFHVYPRGSKGDQLLGRAVRTARWRYIEWQSFTDGSVKARELYDYEKDPGEPVNLADNPENAQLIKDLAARIAALGPAKPQVQKNPSLKEPKSKGGGSAE